MINKKDLELKLLLRESHIQQLNLKVEDYKNAYDSVIIANKMLEKENKRLNNIINKAIEYIESYMPNYDFDKTNLIKVLDILKGVDKE